MNSRPAYRRAISMRSSRPWMRLSAGSTNRPETPYIGIHRRRIGVRQDAAIDGRRGRLRQGVLGVTCAQHGAYAGGPQQGVVERAGGKTVVGLRVGMSARHRAHVLRKLAAA